MTTTPDKPKRRRWFRFSLRTMFVLLTILGVFLGWLTVQFKWIHDRHEAQHWLQSKLNALIINSPSRSPPWPLKILGEPKVDVIWIPLNESTRLEELKRLFPEADVCVGSESPHEKALAEMLMRWRATLPQTDGGTR